MAGPQESYNIFLSARQKGMFSAAGVLESTQRVFKGDAEHALLNTRVADPGAAAKLAAALSADVSKLAGRRARQNKVDFKDLPHNLIDALIATEDVRFEQHSGIDAKSVLRAVTGVLTGPSTGEQVAQNMGWLETAIPDELWIELRAEGLLDAGGWAKSSVIVVSESAPSMTLSCNMSLAWLYWL